MLCVIPKPKKAVEKNGVYTIQSDFSIKSDFDLPLVPARRDDNADFVISKDDSTAKEGYKITVKTDFVKICASTKIGAYYALQTLRKISHYDLGGKTIPCCEIEDEPRFNWRGINIDEARHFGGVDEIKRILDFMFMEKLNVLHWHLTDDQGWRIEIKKYPLLTEIGSKRDYTHIGGWRCKNIDKTPYSGYYTREQVEDILAYAEERGIMVVPEIDFPAHSAAVLAAYNNLACREMDREVPGYFGGIVPEKVYGIKDWNRTLCLGKQEVFDFVFGVLDEICDIFDAPYVHMGGDEAPTNEWKKCPKCQQTMKENNLKNERMLQGWFENKVSDYLKTKGKKLIGWNEILSAENVEPSNDNIVVQYWTPKRDKNAENFVNNGGKMIMSKHQSFYFDMTYAQYPLKNTYEFTPERFGVKPENLSNVLGVEGEIWREWIADREKLDLMLFPRMQALSEVAWSVPENMNWNDFKTRLDDFKPVFDKLKINYAVDKVSLIKNPFTRLKIQHQFFCGNPYLETQLNKKYKAKGEQ